MAVHNPAHLPCTPAWTCTSCDQPWPCPTQRRLLLAEHAPRASVGLLLYLAGCLAVATADLPAEPAGALRERFLGWVSRPHRTR